VCEVRSSDGDKMCLFADLLGDPLYRIRHSPAFLMRLSCLRSGCGEARQLAQLDAGGRPHPPQPWPPQLLTSRLVSFPLGKAWSGWRRETKLINGLPETHV
jgi:hypothetical protein